MRLPHLLAVTEGPEAFATLWEAARAAGLRLGWLELGEREPVGRRLEAAAASGAFRAVQAAQGRVASLKPLRGEPVLRDLLREHFAGCAGVLVRGLPAHPRLATQDGGWRLELSASVAPHGIATDELVALLRRARPFA